MRLRTMHIFLCFGLTQSGYAQANGEAKGQAQRDLAALRSEVSELQTQQKEIVSRLDEIKQLLQASGRSHREISSVNIRGETFRGDDRARVAIIEYADFQCPYCGEYEQQVFPKLLRDYIESGKVKYFYRDLPLPGHTRALPAARAARCAGEQGKYWEMHDSLFANQTALSDPAILDRTDSLGLDKAKLTECLSSDRYTADIQKNLWEAQQRGIDGTPTFYVGVVEPSGDVTVRKRLQGTAPFDVFKTEIDTLLASTEPVSTQ